MKILNLSILTPDNNNVFSGEVTRVKVPGADGSFDILPGHAAIISSLQKGAIRYTIGKDDFFINVSDGIVEVANNKVIVLVESAKV